MTSDSTTWPRFTVVTPSFNQANYLEETICSVLDQNYPALEYILIDGRSTDGSLDVIRKYENRLAYWVSEKDGGQSEALNKGFRRASGEIIGWLNSDDCYLPQTLQKVARAMEQNPGVDLVYGDVEIIDEDSRVLRTAVTYGEMGDFFRWPEGRGLTQQSVFWKRTLFEKIGYIREDLHFIMDYEFLLRARLVVGFFHLPEPIAQFRIHPKSKTTNLQGIRLTEHVQVSKEYWDRTRQFAPGDYWRRVYDKVGRYQLGQVIDDPDALTTGKMIAAFKLAPSLLKEPWVYRVFLNTIIGRKSGK